jgi:hypothetical protein
MPMHATHNFHPSNKITLVGAPGFADGFEAWIIPGLNGVEQHGEEPVSVITTDVGDIHVVPASTVRFPEKPSDNRNAEMYRAEWSTKADRNPRDVYIPEALR